VAYTNEEEEEEEKKSFNNAIYTKVFAYKMSK
jgi:hypothetical protein